MFISFLFILLLNSVANLQKAPSVMWVFRCPVCGHREPKWEDKKLSCVLPEMPPKSWFSETGCGEILVASRGFYNIGRTSVVPQPMLANVRGYLSQQHKAYIRDVQALVKADTPLDSLFEKDGDFVVFQDQESGVTRILSRQQARVLHKLAEQEKFAELAAQKIASVKSCIADKATPAHAYLRAWNTYNYAKGAFSLNGKTALLDKHDCVIKESIIEATALERNTKDLRNAMRRREGVLQVQSL